MCCTITIPGHAGARPIRTSRIASVPPVEAPMAMTAEGSGGRKAERTGWPNGKRHQRFSRHARQSGMGRGANLMRQIALQLSH